MLLMDISGPSRVDMPYAVTATTMNFSIGSWRTLSQAPRRVSSPFNMPPQEGAISMSENTMPSDCAQSGSAE